MSLEDVKNAKKSEVTSQLVGMIGGGFPIDDTHRVLSAQDPVYTYILNYWLTASVDSYDVPVYDNFGNVTSLEFPDQMSAEKQMPLFTSSLQMIRELGAKYLPLYALSLDLRHFALIFCFADSSDTDDYVESLTDILQSISGTLQNYYNVTLRCGIGIPVLPLPSVTPTSTRDRSSGIRNPRTQL